MTFQATPADQSKFLQTHSASSTSLDRAKKAQLSVGETINHQINGESLASPQLTTNVFQTQINDTLSTIDVYSQKGKEIINSVENLKKVLDPKILTALRGGAGLENSLKALQSVMGQVKGLPDPKALIDRMIGQFPNLKTALAGLNINNPLIKQLTDSFSELDKIDFLACGKKWELPSIDLPDLSGFKKTLESFSGIKDFFKITDKNAVCAAGISLIKDSIKFKTPCAISTIKDNITDIGSKIKVVSATINDAVSSSNIPAIRELNKFTDSPLLKKLNPSILTDIASKYHINASPSIPSTQAYSANSVIDPSKNFFDNLYPKIFEAPIAEVKSKYNDIIGTFHEIDPDWKTATTTDINGEVLVVKDIVAGSPMFKEVVRQGSISDLDTSNRMLAYGSAFQNFSVEDHLARDFPYTVVSPLIQTTSTAVSPILVNA